jgi:acyl carrier protein
MEREEIKSCTKAVLEEIKKIKYSDDLFDQELVDLNMDSISFIKLLVKLEIEFDITFGEEIILINKNTTINNIIDCISTIIDNKKEVL